MQEPELNAPLLSVMMVGNKVPSMGLRQENSRSSGPSSSCLNSTLLSQNTFIVRFVMWDLFMLGYLVIMFVVFGRGLGNDGICSVVCDLCEVLTPYVKLINALQRRGWARPPTIKISSTPLQPLLTPCVDLIGIGWQGLNSCMFQVFIIGLMHTSSHVGPTEV